MPNLRVRKKQIKKKPRVVARRNSTPHPAIPLAKLINDPCSAPLVAPQYGTSSGGYLTKLSRFLNVDMSVGGSGYIIWFPDYTGAGTGADNPANIFIFQSTSTNGPVNTVTDPLGAGGTNSADINGWVASDPAFSFVNGNVVQDSRTIAACLKLMYTGRNDALAGRVGVFEGFSRDAFLVGGGGAPPTVSELFQYCTHSSRTPMDEVELKFRASEGSEFYRNVNNVEDHAFTLGDPSTNLTTLGTGAPGGVGTGIGFVWTGMDTTSTFTFDILKAIEWRPEFNSQLVAPAQSVARSGDNLVAKALAYLDHHMPGWQHNLVKGTASVAARIAQTAFRGPSNDILRLAATAVPMLL